MPFWEGSKEKAGLFHRSIPFWNNKGQQGAKIKTMPSSDKLQKYFGQHISLDHPEQWERDNPRNNCQIPSFSTIAITQAPAGRWHGLPVAGCLSSSWLPNHSLPQHFCSTPFILSRNCAFLPLALQTKLLLWAASSLSASEFYNTNTRLAGICTFHDNQACEFQGSLTGNSGAQISFGCSYKH